MKKMKILYFCGFGGTNNPDRIKIMEKYGDDVIPVNEDYLHKRNIIREYNGIIRNVNNPIIVGSSLGAYLGFYISNLSRTPALLFNPSFNFKNGGELRSNEHFDVFDKNIIVLSEKDEILNQKANIKYLTSIGGNDIRIEDIGHNVPIHIFEKYFDEFHKNSLEYYDKLSLEMKSSFKTKKKFESKLNYYSDSDMIQVQPERQFTTRTAPEPVYVSSGARLNTEIRDI